MNRYLFPGLRPALIIIIVIFLVLTSVGLVLAAGTPLPKARQLLVLCPS